MPIDRALGLNLQQSAEFVRIPFQRILKQWMAVDLDRAQCLEVLKRVIRNVELDPAFFDLEGFARGGHALNSSLFFPDPGGWGLRLGLSADRVTDGMFPLNKEQVPVISQALKWAFTADDQVLFRKRFSFVGEALLERMFKPKSEKAPFEPMVGAGIQRREHASLLIRSATTSVLIDPIGMSDLPKIGLLPEKHSIERLDAILITHSHSDHWHIPSLLYQLGTDTLTIVPKVKRINFLTPFSFENQLQDLKLNGIAPDWNSTVQIGDMEVDILPFYGEQPTRESPGAPSGVRSVGNCYRINSPDFSVIVVVDSGKDPDGDVIEVLRQSFLKRGPPDLILSCLRTFACPFFGGLSPYWAAISFDRLHELYQQHKCGTLPFTTAGPEGVASGCAEAQARYFLPYAHGFEGLGRPITDIGWGQGERSERESVLETARHLKEAGARTLAEEWNVGDIVRIENGTLRFERIARRSE